MKLDNKSLFIVLAVIFASITSSADIKIPSQPDNHVVDLAGIIDNPTELTLNRYLRELEYKTSAQMVILTVDSLEGEQIEELSLRIAHDTWKLGQKDKDNGVLILIAQQDRKYRFEVGYGLEELLPDSYVGSIGRQFLVPNFRNGDYSRGIELATVAVINPIADDARVRITGMPKSRVMSSEKKEMAGMSKSRLIPPETENILDLVLAISGVVFFIYIFYLIYNSYTIKPHGRGNRHSSWYYGGGFGGSAGGGFGGGGGGGFGGAGATGGW